MFPEALALAGQVDGAAAAGTDPNLLARAAVLAADVALAGDDLDGARHTAEQVLAIDGAGPDVRCHARSC